LLIFERGVVVVVSARIAAMYMETIVADATTILVTKDAAVAVDVVQLAFQGNVHDFVYFVYYCSSIRKDAQTDDAWTNGQPSITTAQGRPLAPQSKAG
jgi:hypothetical protein